MLAHNFRTFFEKKNRAHNFRTFSEKKIERTISEHFLRKNRSDQTEHFFKTQRPFRLVVSRTLREKKLHARAKRGISSSIFAPNVAGEWSQKKHKVEEWSEAEALECLLCLFEKKWKKFSFFSSILAAKKSASKLRTKSRKIVGKNVICGENKQ